MDPAEKSAKARAAWRQDAIPVVLRRTGRGEKLRIKLPEGRDAFEWLKGEHSRSPTWYRPKSCWEAPKAWFNDFVNRALSQYGELYVVQPYREQEKCSPACQNAVGHECQCVCMGEHHGAGNDGSWFEVSDAFSFRWGERDLACRLMRRR